ncbi:hypothetical protein HYY70_05620 [Candidatus Woesearchaeota archaeon]|nr:hypothetical protein [Candidatus Woesearchaeota archaeon]
MYQDRRGFLKTTGRLALVLGVDQSVLEGRAAANIDSIVANAQKADPTQIRKITYSEAAKGDEVLKQRYLDQLLRDNPSPYVKRLIYDPKGERIAAYGKELVARGLVNPDDIKDPKLEDILAQYIGTLYPQLDARQKDALKACMKPSAQNIMNFQKKLLDESTVAGLLYSLRMMGRNEKQYVFVKSAFFDGSEELAQVWLEHEKVHGRHGYGGMRLGSLKIDHTVEKQISDETVTALDDSIAWIDTIKRLKAHPKFGPKSDEYIEAVGNLYFYDLDLLTKTLKPKSPFEKEGIEYQRKQNRQYLDNAAVTEMLKKVATQLNEFLQQNAGDIGKIAECLERNIQKK